MKNYILLNKYFKLSMILIVKFKVKKFAKWYTNIKKKKYWL